ncbi:unnamed protein product [Prorocentrum cordatum]|uniref:TerD domain-containing protein n=1 Tax=Prorocentrum cordatum TaxID=2364126 RepID=A0ABN9VCN8_9DINO|nr:unnamed protein product [Polarella glacialis]
MAGGNPELLRRGLRSAEEHGLRDSELIEGQVLLDEWGVALRDMDVAMALRRTGDLHAAVTRARSIALCDLLLGPFDAALRQLEQGASAERKLHRAMAACKCESLLKALAAACDAEVTDLRLISEARALWERLTSLRAGLAEAVESTDLQTLAVAMYNARSPAALPSREVARADAMLQELREVEQSLIYGQLDGTDDFRTLDAQLGRVKRLKAAGVELDKHALTTASRKSAALQDLDRKKLEIELLDQRTSNTFPKWIEEVPVPHRAQMIPSAVVFGEVDVSFEPRSTTTYVLPREIVECLVTVRSEEEEKEKEEAGAEVAERGLPGVICGEVISLLRSAISGKDEVLHWPAEPVPDVSRDDAVETHVGIYVGALHTAADIVAALVGSQEGALDPDDLGRHAVPWLSWDDMPLEAERSTPRVGPEGGLPLLRHGRKLGDYLTQVRGRVLRRVDLEVSWAAPSPMTARRGSGPGSGPGSGQKLGLACIAFDGESLVEIVDSQGVHGEHYGVRRPLLAKGGCYPDGTLGSVQHGSGEPGGTDGAGRQKQAMQLRIDLVPQRIVDLVFVATAGHGLKSYGALRADVVDADRSRVMASCDVKGAGLNEEVAVVCCLHRGDHDVWTFHSCGGFSRGRVHEPSRDPQGAQPTAFDYQAVLGKLVEMGYPRNEAMRLKVPAVLEGMQRESCSSTGRSSPPR